MGGRQRFHLCPRSKEDGPRGEPKRKRQPLLTRRMRDMSGRRCALTPLEERVDVEVVEHLRVLQLPPSLVQAWPASSSSEA